MPAQSVKVTHLDWLSRQFFNLQDFCLVKLTRPLVAAPGPPCPRAGSTWDCNRRSGITLPQAAGSIYKQKQGTHVNMIKAAYPADPMKE